MNKKPTAKDLQELGKGCTLDGVLVEPVYVGLAGTAPSSQSRIRIVVQQGRYREIRRLLEHCGAPAFSCDDAIDSEVSYMGMHRNDAACCDD